MAEINDKIEADMVDQKDAPASVAPDAPAIAAMNMIQALNSALDVKMAEDPTVVSYGEDAGYFGGVFRVTDHLQKKHGLSRSFDAPISESGIVGTAIGMAAYGLRPVVEIQFADYIYPAYDQIVSEDALSLGRPVHHADGGAQPLRRRHLRGPDAQPVARKPVHPHRRSEGGDPVQPL